MLWKYILLFFPKMKGEFFFVSDFFLFFCILIINKSEKTIVYSKKKQKNFFCLCHILDNVLKELIMIL